MKYRLTHAAMRDIREITAHIRFVQHSPQNARLLARRLKQAFEKLTEIPRLGHIREELQDENALVLVVSGVLVIYDPTLNPLTILGVIHGGRDLHRVSSRQK
jgi:plasmid stabilization system protein ParE